MGLDLSTMCQHVILIICHVFINALQKHLSSSSQNIQVMFGKTIEESADVQRTINKVIVHPSFNEELGVNDIALLRLSETVTFTGSILGDNMNIVN
jgi:Trypsin